MKVNNVFTLNYYYLVISRRMKNEELKNLKNQFNCVSIKYIFNYIIYFTEIYNRTKKILNFKDISFRHFHPYSLEWPTIEFFSCHQAS